MTVRLHCPAVYIVMFMSFVGTTMWACKNTLQFFKRPNQQAIITTQLVEITQMVSSTWSLFIHTLVLPNRIGASGGESVAPCSISIWWIECPIGTMPGFQLMILVVYCGQIMPSCLFSFLHVLKLYLYKRAVNVLQWKYRWYSNK